MMDSQQESFRGKRTINADRVSWTTRTELRAYTVDSQQNPEDQSTLSPYLDQAKRGAAGNSHWLPSYHTTPESKPPSFIAYQLPRTPSEQGSQPGMLIPFCPHVSEHQRLALINAMAHPPVTRASLTELDLTSIFCNISLRSDINFESDLHFMPIGGKRAEQKRKEAEEYWLALAAELQIHHHTRLECSPARGERHFACESFTPRLSQMFTDLRELLEILVPDRDHISIAENLDVPFLMQQVQNGVLDIPRLAKWLAFLLKSHCAPMRDEWADHMTQQVEEGARSSDMVLLVRGIEKLFSVLEAMKLDVANHQIRTFRFLLMENTIQFQQSFFRERVVDDRISRACHEWYHEAKQLHNLLAPSSRTGSNTNAYESLIYGMISTLFQASSELPKSFQYDLKRLERIRSDMQDLVNLKMCLRVFDDLHSCIMSERPAFLSSDAHAELQWRILALVDEQGDDEDPWQMSSADVALEITRAACISSRQPAVPLPDWLIQNVHIRLGELISGQTPEFAFIWDTLQKELAVEAVRYAQVFNSMTPLTMSEAQQQWQQRRAQKNISRPLPDMEDIARRLAHVGILHWKVWASLVYLDDIEQASTELPALISPRTETPAGDSTEVLSDVSSSVEMMVE